MPMPQTQSSLHAATAVAALYEHPGGRDRDRPEAPESLERRHVAALLAYVTTTASETEWRRRLDAAVERPSAVDADLIAALEWVTMHLRRADDTLGAGVNGAVSSHLAVCSTLLAGQREGALQRSLARTVGSIEQLAGWLAFDAGDCHTAELHYRAGMEASRLADDPLLFTYLVAHTAQLMASLDELDEALAAAAVVHRLAVKGTSPGTQAYAASIQADIYARQGDAAAALRTLDRAEASSRRISMTEEPSWLYFFDRAEQLFWRGQVELRLQRPARARAAASERLGMLSSTLVRERAFATADLAAACVLQEEVEECAALAIQAMVLARRIGSTRAADRVLALRERLAPFAGAAAVRRLDEYLRTAA
jgi:hypothetical protein